MARCFCGDTGACDCTIEAGAGITVTGSGSGIDPYVITAAPEVGNIVELDTATIDTTVTGSGTGGDPWVISGTAIPEGIQDLIGAALGPGLVYNDAGNLISASISADANNALIFGGDSGLFSPNLNFTTSAPLTDYLNGFSAYAGVGFYEPRALQETGADHIRMRGRIETDGTPTTGQTIATLPVGMEPQRTVQLSVTGNDGTMVFLDFTVAGLIICRTSGTYSALSLDGVTFYVGAN